MLRGNSSLSFLLILGLGAGLASTNEDFHRITTCTCFGQNITYECTAVGGITTLWSGTAFIDSMNRSSCEINLRHNTSPFTCAKGQCNRIFAIGVEMVNNHFTSQLNVTLSAELVGKTVECSVTTLNDAALIGNDTLTSSFPPPRNVILDHAGPFEISFTWSKVPLSDSCLSFFYSVNGDNCGTCSPVTTTNNTSTCTNFSSLLLSQNNFCNFTVRSVILCDNNIVGEANNVVVMLKVPDPPIIQVVPHYSYQLSYLIKLTTSFNERDSFNISDDPQIDGSPIDYTIMYTDTSTGGVCHSDTIMASSCINRSCNHIFDVSSSSNCTSLPNINVTVFATNVLGNGTNSTQIKIDGINRYVNITFDSTTKRVMCLFLNEISNSIKYCNATVRYGEECDQQVGMYSNTSNSNSVLTPQIEFINDVSKYCLFAIAVSDNITIAVEGMIESSYPSMISSEVIIIAIAFLTIYIGIV